MAAKVEHYGRLGHDVDITEVRATIEELRRACDAMEHLIDNPITHEAVYTWAAMFNGGPGEALLNASKLRPVFMSHLIGRLIADGVSFAAIAEKLGTNRQRINDLYYQGPSRAPTEVPRRRAKAKAPVVKAAS